MVKILRVTLPYQIAVEKINFNTILFNKNFRMILLSLRPRIKTSVKTLSVVIKMKYSFSFDGKSRTMFPSMSVINHTHK